jgi:UDP-N-acetylglucosamine 2-epimerase (non-hydrolysing)
MARVRVLSVVGARPNYMKMAPVLREVAKHDEFESFLVHTGQHYDDAMSTIFFQELGMPEPNFYLRVGSGTHAVQTAEIMKRFEEVCCQLHPGLVIVAGDVNSTLACALTAAKLQIPVGHIESGLRSFDRSMPEEINRIVTDALSDLLFTTEASGNLNLCREGIPEEKIHFVGNTMIDSLVSCYPALGRLKIDESFPFCQGTPYFVATIHRPANVDDPARLGQVLEILTAASRLAPLLFVTHPRTRNRLQDVSDRSMLVDMNGHVGELRRGYIYLLPPLGYLEFLWLMSKSAAVLTDSGGIQEETTFLRVPCLTLRDNTERPVTVELGTNQLVGLDYHKILASLDRIMRGDWETGIVPQLWDGRAAERVVEVLQAQCLTMAG